MGPGSERVAALIDPRRRAVSAAASWLATRKLLAKGRVDALVLYLVVAVMVLKPTGDDVAPPRPSWPPWSSAASP